MRIENKSKLRAHCLINEARAHAARFLSSLFATIGLQRAQSRNDSSQDTACCTYIKLTSNSTCKQFVYFQQKWRRFHGESYQASEVVHVDGGDTNLLVVD